MARAFVNTSNDNITLTTTKGGQTQVPGSNRIKPEPPFNIATVLEIPADWRHGDSLKVSFRGKEGWIIGNGTVSGDATPDPIPPAPEEEFPNFFILESPTGKREVYDRRISE